LHRKDLDIVPEAAKNVGAYMPGTDLIRQIWVTWRRKGSRYGKYVVFAIKGAFLEG
jgi:3-hydroxyisobutyrate dehydrogenase-like beta-hydroxyacid dehydrogenase